MSERIVIVLLGPKGSGKTHVGTILERALGVPFLRVEPLFEAIRRGRDPMDPSYHADGFARLEAEVDALLDAKWILALESLGLAPQSTAMLDRLRARGVAVRLVRLDAALELCARRVASRDPANHVPVDAELLETINRRAAALELPFDLRFENVDLSDEEIVARLRPLVPSEPRA